MLVKTICIHILATAIVLGIASATSAQHSDVLLQRLGDKIAVGLANFDGGQWSIGARVFTSDFPSDYTIDQPGFNALSATSPALPPGYAVLPGSSPVEWDFLPMTINDAVSNLWYWDGLDTNDDGVDELDVAFVILPGHALSLEGEIGTAIADGSDRLVPGGMLGTTGSNGSLHVHRDYSLDTGDPGADPVDGIYLVALHARLAGIETSDAFFIVFGTPDTMPPERNAAIKWVTDRVDSLVSFTPPGDYNHDGTVDAADYTVWRDTGGDATAFQEWKTNFGQSLGQDGALAAVATVPEPGTLGPLLTVLLATAFRRRKYCVGSPAAIRTVDANRGAR